MKITIISYYYLPEYSGAAKQIHNLISKFTSYGIRVNVISAQLDPSWPLEECIDNYNVFRIPVDKKKPLFQFWFGSSHLLLKLRNQTDVLLLNGLKPAHSFCALFSRLLKIPVAGRLSIANSDINFRNQGRMVGRLNYCFLRHVSRYIAISTELKNELFARGFHQDQCSLIANGVDTAIFKPPTKAQREYSRERLNLYDTPTILFVGVIDARKGIDILVESISILSNSHPRIKVILVGPRNRDDIVPGFFEGIQKSINTFGISSIVDIFDYTEDVLPYYFAADIFVLPSRQEGMANVILEAMACGLPVVATKISGTEDLISDKEDGLLVPSENPHALAEALKYLLERPNVISQMGFSALYKIQSFFSIEATAHEYLSIFKTII